MLQTIRLPFHSKKLFNVTKALYTSSVSSSSTTTTTSSTTNLRNQKIVAKSDDELETLRTKKWDLFSPSPSTYSQVQFPSATAGSPPITKQVRHGLTFTPYAFATICNANCTFCSENLERKKGDAVLKANSSPRKRIRDYDLYFDALRLALETLNHQVPSIGLSLSGLEATSEPQWLLRLLKLLQEFPTLFDELVLYTNGSGFALHPELIEAFRSFPFTRVELSRQHYDEAVNQKIMRFERNQLIQLNRIYEPLVKNHISNLFSQMKNSCILTKPGVNSPESIERYLDWAHSLNVSKVVFRELSIISDSDYVANKTKTWIDENRVPVEPILRQLAPTLSKPRSKFEYQFSTVGYYYTNECYRYDNKIDVILEISSYCAHFQALQENNNTVNKMIFHPNMNLSADWDADLHVITNFGDVVKSRRSGGTNNPHKV